MHHASSHTNSEKKLHKPFQALFRFHRNRYRFLLRPSATIYCINCRKWYQQDTQPNKRQCYHLWFALLLLCASCAPSCNPAVVEAGFIARVSQAASTEKPLMVLYDDYIPLSVQLTKQSRLLNRYGEAITLSDIQPEQRVWLRGQLETRAGNYYVRLKELRVP